MITRTYFFAEESPCHKDMYLIMGKDIFYNFVGKIKGSYHVFQARAFGLTYASYLRMLRDNYNATIIGKGHKYPVAYFKNKEDISKIIAELNKRFTILASRY